VDFPWLKFERDGVHRSRRVIFGQLIGRQHVLQVPNSLME
jgi:hypothetical protein